VADQLVNGVRFRALTVLDVCTREALAIQGGRRFRTEDVVAVCSRIAAKRAYPARVFVDNGSEFSGRVFDLWAHHQRYRAEALAPHVDAQAARRIQRPRLHFCRSSSYREFRWRRQWAMRADGSSGCVAYVGTSGANCIQGCALLTHR
jgi:hypothetical protein